MLHIRGVYGYGDDIWIAMCQVKFDHGKESSLHYQIPGLHHLTYVRLIDRNRG